MGIQPKVGNSVEFSLRKEDWSKYEILEGKAQVWVRAVLVRLMEVELPPGQPSPPGGSYAVATQNIVTAYFDKSMLGAPDVRQYTPEELATGGSIVDFSAIHEPFNQYVIAGKKPKMIQTKAVATNIRVFYDKRNQFGEPVVQIDSNVIVSNPTDVPGHVSR